MYSTVVNRISSDTVTNNFDHFAYADLLELDSDPPTAAAELDSNLSLTAAAPMVAAAPFGRSFGHSFGSAFHFHSRRRPLVFLPPDPVLFLEIPPEWSTNEFLLSAKVVSFLSRLSDNNRRPKVPHGQSQ